MSPANVVTIRQTCKKWRDVFDEYCCKPHTFQKQCMDDLPYVCIQLPLDEAGVNRVRQLAECNQNPFVAGRLGIHLRRTMRPQEKTELRQLLEETKTAGRHVKHLVITACHLIPDDSLRGPNGLCQAIANPWTKEMTQVVSITCDVPSLGADVIDVLPNPELVQYVYVFNSLTFRDNPLREDWQRLVEKCCANVKWFWVEFMGRDLQVVVESMSFPNIERFMVEEYRGFNENGRQYLSELITPERFPILQDLGIPLDWESYEYGSESEDGDVEDDGREDDEIEDIGGEETSSEDDASDDGKIDQETLLASNNVRFLTELVNFTHRMGSLETIYVYAENFVSLSTFPISDCTNRRASGAVKKLEFPNVCMKRSWPWVKVVSTYFPGVRSINLHDRKMTRSKNGDWEFVGGEIYCDDCV